MLQRHFYTAGLAVYITLKPVVWFALTIYVAIIALGCALLWVAYQVAFCKRYSLIRDGGKAVHLEQATETARPFAVLAAVFGVAVISFAIAIPIAQIRFGTWQFYLMVLASVAGVARHIVVWNYRRRRSLTSCSSGSPTAPAESQR